MRNRGRWIDESFSNIKEKRYRFEDAQHYTNPLILATKYNFNIKEAVAAINRIVNADCNKMKGNMSGVEDRGNDIDKMRYVYDDIIVMEHELTVLVKDFHNAFNSILEKHNSFYDNIKKNDVKDI